MLVVVVVIFFFVFFFKQKTAYEMRISDWSSDVCSSDLYRSRQAEGAARGQLVGQVLADQREMPVFVPVGELDAQVELHITLLDAEDRKIGRASCRERVCQYV